MADNFTEELRTFSKQYKSIFGFELLASVEHVLSTKILPLKLTYAGVAYRVSIDCRLRPYDLVFHDNAIPLAVIVKERPPNNMDVLRAVHFAKRIIKMHQKEKIRENPKMVKILESLELLKISLEILSYEFTTMENDRTLIYVEVPIPTLGFMKHELAIKGRDVNADRFVLKMMFKGGGQPVLNKFGVQFNPEVHELVTEVEKKIKDLQFDQINRFVKEVKMKVTNLLEEVVNKFELRKQLFLRLFAAYQPLGLVKGMNAATMCEMNICLGEGKLLNIVLKPTYPSCLPALSIYKKEKDMDTPSKTMISKASVFKGEKEPNQIAENLMSFIYTECMLSDS